MNQSRESLINSAVAFLQDPSVSDAPLAKRLAFLESKGLNPSETDEALRRASHLPRSNQVSSYPHQSNELGRDWRDWFIMSVVGGGVGYLAISLVKVSLTIESFRSPFKYLQANLRLLRSHTKRKTDREGVLILHFFVLILSASAHQICENRG